MIVLILVGIALCFSLVVLVGPPYLPTLTKQMNVALDMLDLRPGETMIELGCGDGKVLIAAAQRGWKVIGIELNPILAVLCWLRTWRYRKQVRIVWGNYWNLNSWTVKDGGGSNSPGGQAKGIFGFVLPKYMPKLDECIKKWQKAEGQKVVRLASFAFAIPDKKIVRQKDGVFLYEYS